VNAGAWIFREDESAVRQTASGTRNYGWGLAVEQRCVVESIGMFLT
jgi:hypothetical protein